MRDEVLKQISNWAKQDYNCSQILMLLYLTSVGKSNNSMISALNGLGYQFGKTGGTCGLLTVGICIICSLPSNEEEKNSKQEILISQYHTWFKEHAQSSTLCLDILSSFNMNDNTKLNPLCSTLIIDCWEKILTLYEEQL